MTITPRYYAIANLCRLAAVLAIFAGLFATTASGQDAGLDPVIWVTPHYNDHLDCAGFPCEGFALKISGQGFTLGGDILIQILNLDADDIVEVYMVTAGSHAGFEAGSFGLQTTMRDCSGHNSFIFVWEVIAIDWETRKESNVVPIYVCMER